MVLMLSTPNFGNNRISELQFVEYAGCKPVINEIIGVPSDDRRPFDRIDAGPPLQSTKLLIKFE